MEQLTPEQLRIERLELRIALGGRSAERAAKELAEYYGIKEGEDSDPK